MSKVALRKEGHIAIISVERPEALNALSREIVEDMDLLIEEVKKDADIYCLIFHSEKNFAAGADIKAMATCNEEEAKAFCFSPVYDKIGELVVHHQARKYGSSKFGISRFFHGYLDLISLWFLSRFSRRPMHIFGLWGTLMFLIGFVSAIIVGGAKLIALANCEPSRLVTDSPYFYIALTMMILGTQLFLTGFIAELVSRTSQDRNKYNISKEI